MTTFRWEKKWRKHASYFCDSYHHDGLKYGYYGKLRAEMLREKRTSQYSVDVIDTERDCCPMSWELHHFDTEQEALDWFEEVIKEQAQKLEAGIK